MISMSYQKIAVDLKPGSTILCVDFHELFVSLDVVWILCIYVLPKIQISMDVLPKI
jgi:hypothetical protein